MGTNYWGQVLIKKNKKKGGRKNIKVPRIEENSAK